MWHEIEINGLITIFGNEIEKYQIRRFNVSIFNSDFSEPFKKKKIIKFIDFNNFQATVGDYWGLLLVTVTIKKLL